MYCRCSYATIEQSKLVWSFHLQRALNWRNTSTKEGEAEKSNFQELLTSDGQKVHQRFKVQTNGIIGAVTDHREFQLENPPWDVYHLTFWVWKGGTLRELTPPSEQAKIGKRVRQVLNAIFNPTQMVFQGKRRLAGTSAQYVQTTGRCPALKASLLSGTETNMVREQNNYHVLKEAL